MNLEILRRGGLWGGCGTIQRLLALAVAGLVQPTLSAAFSTSISAGQALRGSRPPPTTRTALQESRLPHIVMASSSPATLTYWRGRGRANPIRFMLEETGTPYTESFLTSKTDIEKLRSDGLLMYNQVPLLQIDGMNLVQSEACLRYLARKHNMLGNDAAESAVVDMVHAATLDIRACCLPIPFLPREDRAPRLEAGCNTTIPKFLGPIDKLLSGSRTGFVAGGDISLADVTLFESVCFLLDAPYITNEWFDGYPAVKIHHELMKSRKQLSDYLMSDRCLPFPDDAYAATVKATLS